MLNPGLASSVRLSSQLALEILSCTRIADRPLCWPRIYMGTEDCRQASMLGTEDLNSSPHACPEIALASGPFPELFHLILRQDLSLSPGLPYWLGWLVNSPWGSSFLCLSSTGVTNVQLSCWAFKWVHSKHLTN